MYFTKYFSWLLIHQSSGKHPWQDFHCCCCCSVSDQAKSRYSLLHNRFCPNIIISTLLWVRLHWRQQLWYYLFASENGSAIVSLVAHFPIQCYHQNLQQYSTKSNTSTSCCQSIKIYGVNAWKNKTGKIFSRGREIAPVRHTLFAST